MHEWLLRGTAVFVALGMLALLVLSVVDERRESQVARESFRAAEQRAEDRAEENRRLLERLAGVVESMERSAREHRCSSELSLLQMTDLIRFGHTHPQQYVAHLEASGCGEFVPVLPGLPTASPESRSTSPRQTPRNRGPDGQPDENRNEPPGDDPDDDPDDDDDDHDPPDDDPPDEDPPLVCVNPPLVPPVCVG